MEIYARIEDNENYEVSNLGHVRRVGSYVDLDVEGDDENQTFWRVDEINNVIIMITNKLIKQILRLSGSIYNDSDDDSVDDNEPFDFGDIDSDNEDSLNSDSETCSEGDY